MRTTDVARVCDRSAAGRGPSPARQLAGLHPDRSPLWPDHLPRPGPRWVRSRGVYDDGTIYLEEGDINLDVAYGLKALLDTDGAYYVGMTRTEDVYKALRQSTIVFLHFDRLNRPCSC